MKSNVNKTEKFEIVMGVNKGYFHNNEENKNIYEMYQEIAKEIFEKRNVYISCVITESRVVYHTDWGCPSGGEVVYRITGERNPEFMQDKTTYKACVEEIAIKLANKLEQSTFTLTWQEVELNYFKKD